MNTAQIWQTDSTSSKATMALAESVGSRLRGGETIELVGDLGSGKTLFVQGLAKGLGSRDVVHSPSFTISNQYRAGKLTIYHFDFYRLSEPGIMQSELAEVLNDPATVVAIEWAKIVDNILPADCLSVNIKTTSKRGRKFTFEYPDNLSYLLPANT